MTSRRHGPSARSRPDRSTRTLPRGYSLVEIMVAMVLVALIATSLAAYNGYTARARQLSEQRALALIAAQEAIDVVRSAAFDSIATGTRSVVSTVGKIPLTVRTAIQLATFNMKLVSVTVMNSRGTTLQTFVTAVFKPR